MMTKSDVWRYVKTGGFWLIYAVLMGLNLMMVYYLSTSLYYEVFDPQYWREHYTMYPYVDVEIPTSIYSKLEYLKGVIPTIIAVVWGNYRLYKRKKGSLWILGFWMYVAIWNIIYIEILGWGAWCPGHDFP